MSDRELLELAARAAGITAVWLEWMTSQSCAVTGTKFTKRTGLILDGGVWNPLNDDGDALRLAVKLGLSVQVINRNSETQAIYHVGYELQKHGDDPFAATRRAITRAAAAIGAEIQRQRESK
jgi:hypothetical protein